MFKIPELRGDLPQHEHIIYFSCDDVYYHEYGVPLIKSIVHQIPWITVHCHLLLKDDVSFYNHKRVSYSYERITDEFIKNIPEPRIVKNGQKKDKLIVYYSCARFLQIDKLFKPHQSVLQIDCDSLLFNPFPQAAFEVLTNKVSCMRKPKSPEKVIASALSLGKGNSGQIFRETLVTNLLEKMQEQGAYWFIDQDVLQGIFNNDNYNSMPQLWNTWSFKKKDAYFRTGKGHKKEQGAFKIELAKWKEHK